jgi:hypothetical protein
MFEDADAFDGDVSTFNISNVETLQMMFRNAVSFTGTPDLSLWDFTNVQDAREMFYGALSFQGIGLSSWNILSLQKPNLMVRYFYIRTLTTTFQYHACLTSSFLTALIFFAVRRGQSIQSRFMLELACAAARVGWDKKYVCRYKLS